MPIILDGKALADKICLELKGRADKLKAAGITPRLAIVTSGDDAASKVYVRNKVRRAEEIGIAADVMHFDSVSRQDVISLHARSTPIIYQMPMTGTATMLDLSQFVDPCFDVDGFVSDDNIATLASGRQPFYYPCTPKGIMRILSAYDFSLDQQHICIIGRSNIVGRPLARMMEQAGATVTLCHSKTPTWMLRDMIHASDIIISATGQRNIISYSELTQSKYDRPLTNQIFIDVGMNRDENGKLCGDIDPEIFKHCKAYTPVPGGVGPMTVAMLMENVIECYERAIL